VVYLKILGLVGSPRKQGNTDLLVNAVLEGAAKKGYKTEKLYLYKVDILPCLDCKACKKGSFQCALCDDMQKLYPKLEEAAIIVFGTPLYWYGASAKMKLLVDRLRPFVASKGLQGKRAVLIVPSEEGAQACRLVVDMFDWSFKYLGVTLSGALLPTASSYGEIKNQPDTLNQATSIGEKMV
jgi:multimeric flavodoxin WrbA